MDTTYKNFNTKTVTTRVPSKKDLIPQSKPLNKKQIKNAAGGYVHKLDDFKQFQRFLILGSESGTYYVGSNDLTKTNVANMNKVFKKYGPEAVQEIIDVSVDGRAPRVDPQLFALALASAHDREDVRRAALLGVAQVCRTFTHLATYLEYVKNFRKLGTGVTKAIARWYNDKPVDQVAYQAVKYRNREGWTHRDLLRISHPKTSDEARKDLFDYLCGRDAKTLPKAVEGFEKAQKAKSVGQAVKVLDKYNLPWEVLPTQFHNEAAVWEQLIDSNQLGLTALIRQLPRLTNLGVNKSRRKEIKAVLQDTEALKAARIHPIVVLNAMKAYQTGRTRSGVVFSPDQQIVDALDQAFYASVGFVEPTGKRILIALDVSGSMGWGAIANMNLTPAEASAALAMITANTEDDYEIMGFARDFRNLGISPGMRLDQVVSQTRLNTFGGTDCALPMTWAAKHGHKFDAFLVFTDNETWAGHTHPSQALKSYRKTSGIEDAKLVVVGMTATDCSIADPKDPGMLDIAGMSTDVPDVMSDFIRN